MPRAPRQWIYSPRKRSRVPDFVKKQATAKADGIIETLFKPRYIKPPPKNARFNYIVDIFTKWHKNCLYFRAKYACPGPNVLSPFFEENFTRLEYMATGRFNLAYMRHTGKWWVLFEDLPTEEAFAAVRDQVFFHPPG
ncbi:MAG: DUF3024 domain-containing protein [Planctomycetota bacterium]|jgi:hypothetical protein